MIQPGDKGCFLYQLMASQGDQAAQRITNAGNRINLGNAMAGSRGILGNNLMNLAGLAVKAYGMK